jgi:hypothetical protein
MWNQWCVPSAPYSPPLLHDAPCDWSLFAPRKLRRPRTEARPWLLAAMPATPRSPSNTLIRNCVWYVLNSFSAHRIQHDNNGRQVLIVDTAEPAEVRSELAKVNATMASAKLVSGDFAWMAVPVETPTSEYVSRGMMLNTGVERKRVSDLVASIRDQRLKTQMCCCPPVPICFSRRCD